jgi:tRNA (mo5U34)-methyltransferase
MTATRTIDPSDAQRRVDAHPFWYHTIDVAPGVATRGWFDLRSVVDLMPWPDVRGKRCLDIGTFDGYLAFELERRGAAEVVAVDIEDHVLWDWPPDARPGASGTEGYDPGFTGPPKGAGFRLAAEILDSKVDWRAISIYDLNPAEIGTFDVVVCGTLLLHLQNPVRALEAVRSVCSGVFLSSEQIELWTSILHRGHALARLDGSGRDCQWWVPNAAGHYRMLYSAGFEIIDASKPYVVGFNHHPKPQLTARNAASRLATAAITRSWQPGVLHRALLGRPRI